MEYYSSMGGSHTPLGYAAVGGYFTGFGSSGSGPRLTAGPNG